MGCAARTDGPRDPKLLSDVEEMISLTQPGKKRLKMKAGQKI
jgi:hypothetical protein